MATVAITPDQDVVTGEIFIAAPPARVFQAITDPNQMPQWWGASNMYRIKEWKADLRVGGKWPSDGVGVDGKTFRVEGEYLEVDPPRLLVHTWICTWMGTVQPSSAGNSCRKASTACIRTARSAPAPARWSKSASKASPAESPTPPATPKVGSASWDGSSPTSRKERPSTCAAEVRTEPSAR